MPRELPVEEVRPQVLQPAHEDFATLSSCFVDGNTEQRQRERWRKRRSLVISVCLQVVALAAIILIPLFGKPERIVRAAYIPIPPYNPYVQHRPQTPTQPQPSPTPRPCIFCFRNLQSHPSTTDGPRPTTEQTPVPGEFENLGAPSQIPIGDNRTTTSLPPPPPPGPKMVHVTHIDPATLMRRVEPAYPVLAGQIRKEGQVQLHAIIATDGTIQSLQYAGGDMMFFTSARDAVLQWRYHPTILNGQPVEVDTTITVIYTLAH